MTMHNSVDGECFTLKILCPEISEVYLAEQKRLEKYLNKILPVDKIHLGLKYMAYETDYSDDYMKSLVPEIRKIVDQFLPTRIEIQGLGGFWNDQKWPSKPIIFLKVKLTTELKEFHNALREFLKDKVDTFILAEGENYSPHITLGVGDENKSEELKEIVNKSQFTSTIVFTAKKFAMRLKDGKTHTITNGI